jgi:hypothetical protein
LDNLGEDQHEIKQCSNQSYTISTLKREHVFNFWDDWDLFMWFYGLEEPGLGIVFDRNIS